MTILPLLVVLAAAQAPAALSPAPRPAQDCNAHKFDTVVSAEVDGKMQSKRLRLCGEIGQSDAEWLETLEDSIAKLDASDTIAKPMREAMKTSLAVEIVRLKASAPPAPALATAPVPPPPLGSAAPVTGEITLKPRAAPPKAGTGLAGYNGLPPLPEPIHVKPGEAAAFVPPPPIARPKLDIECFNSSLLTEGPCDELDRDGIVIVRAQESVGRGVALLFMVNGKERSDIDLSGMRKGQRRNLAMPEDVCRGTVGGRLELRVMVTPQGGKYSPQRAESIGPLLLRCT